eukprot:11246267-Ditylum_brightwellii.AAC.1
MSNHDFGAATGSDAGKQMSTYTLEDGNLCGIIRKADVTWRNKQPGDTLLVRHIGSRTHQHGHPSSWPH